MFKRKKEREGIAEKEKKRVKVRREKKIKGFIVLVSLFSFLLLLHHFIELRVFFPLIELEGRRRNKKEAIKMAYIITYFKIYILL